MTAEGSEGRLREKTIFLLACGGMLLLLGLMLGVVVSKRNKDTAPNDVQVGGEQGLEHALVVEGVAPRVVPKNAEFVVRARVTNVGDEPLRDLTLTIGAQTLIMPVPAGTTPTLQIDILPPGESRELIATLQAIEVGRTSIAAHARDDAKRVAAGRYWDVEVSEGDVTNPEYMPGAAMAVRVITFGPAVVDAARPFELQTFIENSGQVALDNLRLTIRAGDGIRSMYSEDLDYDIGRLLPGGAQPIRTRFKFAKPVARGQIHVYTYDEAGWVAGVGVQTVTTRP